MVAVCEWSLGQVSLYIHNMSSAANLHNIIYYSLGLEKESLARTIAVAPGTCFETPTYSVSCCMPSCGTIFTNGVHEPLYHRVLSGKLVIWSKSNVAGTYNFYMV